MTAFARLPPADRKVARALWEAQRPGPGRLTLDEIAAMRRRRRPWGAIVRELQRAGCLTPGSGAPGAAT